MAPTVPAFSARPLSASPHAAPKERSNKTDGQLEAGGNKSTQPPATIRNKKTGFPESTDGHFSSRWTSATQQLILHIQEFRFEKKSRELALFRASPVQL